MVLGDLAALHAHTIRAALSRIVAACSVGSKLSIQEEKDICGAGVQIHQSDFEVALSKLQSAHADSIGAPKVSPPSCIIKFENVNLNFWEAIKKAKV